MFLITEMFIEMLSTVFKKEYFKLISNSTFGKTMKNLIKNNKC